MPMPKPTPAATAFFERIIPKSPATSVKPMFGNWAAFHNGNMFSGVFGDAVFIRLPPGEREQLMEDEGVGLFEPMKGRPMGEYVTLPGAWRKDPDKARAWVARSVKYVGAMPAKAKKGGSPKAKPRKKK